MRLGDRLSGEGGTVCTSADHQGTSPKNSLAGQEPPLPTAGVVAKLQGITSCKKLVKWTDEGCCARVLTTIGTTLHF